MAAAVTSATTLRVVLTACATPASCYQRTASNVMVSASHRYCMRVSEFDYWWIVQGTSLIRHKWECQFYGGLAGLADE